MVLLMATAGGCTLVLGADQDYHLVSTGSSGGSGGAGGSGGSGGAECPTMCCSSSDCPSPSDPCKAASCEDGACVESQVATDTPLPDALQIEGDCRVLVCDDLGMQAPLPDDTDLPGSPDACNIKGCKGGMVVTTPADAGTACTLNGGGAGACCNGFCLATVAEAAVGSLHTCARMSSGALWCWGTNSAGQLGIGNTMNQSSPVDVSALGTDVAEVTAGDYHTCARKTDGTLWCWGYNASGQLGTGDTTDQWSPAQIGALGTDVAQVSTMSPADHTCARKTDGTLWCWGGNGLGQLGIGDTTNQPSPVQVGGIADVVEVSVGGAHTCARKADGTAWCWGYNATGQLGNGDTANQPSPVQVGGIADVAQISAGDEHTCARKTDNTLWCWGKNSYGQLGTGDTANQSSPVQVGALGTEVAQVSTSNDYTCARKSDGTVWCWGWNKFGELGTGDTTDQWSPAPVSGLGGAAVEIATGSVRGCAVRADGTLWCWGAHYTGADPLLPVQVPLGGCM